MNSKPGPANSPLLSDALLAGAVAIALSGLATGLSFVALDANQRTGAAFYLDLVAPVLFTCLAGFRLRRHGASPGSLVLALVTGLILTFVISGVLDRLINCHFGNCTSLIDG